MVPHMYPAMYWAAGEQLIYETFYLHDLDLISSSAELV